MRRSNHCRLCLPAMTLAALCTMSPAALHATIAFGPASLWPGAPASSQDDATSANPPALRETAPKRDTGTPQRDKDAPLPSSAVHNPVLWHEPAAISSLDLFIGQGGQKHEPAPPFFFLDEDSSGTNPKFDVRDTNGTRWRVKLGEEARPEVVASRLLWAVGYYADDDYNLSDVAVSGLLLKRGENDVHNGHVLFARFARKPSGEKKIGIWQWKDNPFVGTREFNGLRVMMAVLNNWDLKDENNAVFSDKKTGEQIFLVSDVGATFASNNLRASRAQDKGNLHSYEDSRFITKKTGTTVSFGTPSAPGGLFNVIGTVASTDYFRRRQLDWIGQDIPLADARWIGGLLGQLTHAQLTDAFRAGNLAPDDVDEYVRIVESRIAELKAL